jgi:DNA-3-methyladenine glycosylase II
MLKPVAPFDFSKSMEFLSDFGPMQNDQEVKSGAFTKAVQLSGKTIGFEVFDKGTVENPKLEFTAYCETKFTDQVKELVADRISFFLSLQDNLNEFYGIAKKDLCIQPAIKQFYGHKQVKFLTPFEISCWAILTQRVPMNVARKMKENIVKKVGGRIKIKGVDYYSFPEPTSLLAKSVELPQLMQNKRKAEYLSFVAEAFSKVDEDWLRTSPYDVVYDWLTDIKGIGDWSANFVMIRGLGRTEELSNIEPQLALDVARIYAGKDDPMTNEKVCEIAENYGKWKGYWAYYLRIYAEFAYVFEKGKKHLTSEELVFYLTIEYCSYCSWGVLDLHASTTIVAKSN